MSLLHHIRSLHTLSPANKDHVSAWRMAISVAVPSLALLAAGRARGHRISETSFLRSRPQRLLRRTHLHRGVKVDWAADLFVLSNIRNGSRRSLPFPSRALARVLATGRTAIHQEAYVDVCTLDMPCGGDPSRCPSGCERSWSRREARERTMTGNHDASSS